MRARRSSGRGGTVVVPVAIGLAASVLLLHATGTSTAAGAVAAIASSLARSNGDASPRAVLYLATTRGAAARATGVGAGADGTPVLLVQMDGHFFGYLAKVPAGRPMPSGRYLSFVVSASRRSVESWGLGNRAVVWPAEPSRLR